jgi:uncharacterized membrane protein YdfJ with MMPL/SSD domain
MNGGLANDPFARFAGFIYRRRWWVLGAWLAAILICAPFAAKANSVLKAGGVQAAGSDSAVAADILDKQFGVSALNNVAIVFHSDKYTVGQIPFRKPVRAAAWRVQHTPGVTKVTTYYRAPLPTLLSKDKHTTIVFASLEGNEASTQTYISGVRKAVEGVPSEIQHYVTGFAAINHDFSKQGDKDLRHAEVYTFGLILILLLLVFRTAVSAFIPLLLAGAAVVTATAGIYAIGKATDTSTFALNVSSMIGLGLAIDFSLIVVSRFRDELKARGDARSALPVTMATAGRSIVYSGVIVFLSMLLLTLFVDLRLIRSISIGVMLVTAAALLVGVTLLPAVLGVLGHRVERLRVLPKRKPRPVTEGFWYGWSHQIMRRPWAWLLASLALILVLAYPALELRMLGSTAQLLPASAEAAKGANVIDKEFGKNQLTPIQIVIHTPRKGGVFKPRFLTGLDKLSNTIAADPRAQSVQSFATYEQLVPRYDGRYKHLHPNHDFWPAPQRYVSPDEPVKGIFVKNIISAWSPKVPWSPAYFGYGTFRFPTGTDRELHVSPALQVYKVEAGGLTVTAGGPTTMWLKKDFNLRWKGKPIAAGSTVTLHPGDQLVVPEQTPVRLRVRGKPVNLTVVISFHVRPGTTLQGSWLDGADPQSDPFAGIPRIVTSGGISMTSPLHSAHIVLDIGIAKPGARYPRHIHPGPELIGGLSGVLTVFSTPEMVITGSQGQVEEGPYDTPSPVGPRGKAVVQGYGIHRAVNFGKVDAHTYSLRFLDASKPKFVIVNIREVAKLFVNLDKGNDYAVVNVIPRYGPYDSRTEGLATAIKTLIVPSVRGLDGSRAYVGGITGNFQDFHDELYGRFPYLIAAVMLLMFVILMMFFRSVFLPVKAILMNLASVLATYGVLVMIFQYGWGSRLAGFTPVNGVAVITPAILFVILFALSTDYEVFMLSRIKENYDRTGDNDEAVATGLQQTARVVTAAGLILVVVFGSFATAGLITIKEIGLGLAIGILIDTFLVRTIMVPATMRIAGRINWVMPDRLERVLPKLSEGPSEAAPTGQPEVGG